MTYSEAEERVAALSIQANINILMARHFEAKAEEFRKLAADYRNRARKLEKRQANTWQSIE